MEECQGFRVADCVGIPCSGVGRRLGQATPDQPREPGRGPRWSLTGPAALGRSHYCSSLRTPGPRRRQGAWPMRGTGSQRAEKAPFQFATLENPRATSPPPAVPSEGRLDQLFLRSCHRRGQTRSCSSQSYPVPFI